MNANMQNLYQQVQVTAHCDGCGYCVNAFECPAIVFDKIRNRADIDNTLCVNCGQCITVCSKGHIQGKLKE